MQQTQKRASYDPETAERAYQMILRCRAALLMTEPFYGTQALRLSLTESTEVGTAAVDGVHFFYNPKFVCSLTKHECIGVTAHEVLHCVLLHFSRRGNRDGDVWNIATDYAINIMLKDAGFILPEGGLVDEQYRGMSAEAIYNLIYDDVKKGGKKPCKWGMVLDAPANDGNSATAADIRELETSWQVATAQAVEQAKGKGSLPGDLAEALKDILKPVIDWREVLWPFFTAVCNEEYSWRRPHRGYISEDEYFPSLHSEACPAIVFIQDSSGSVYTHQLKQCWSEIVAAHESSRPEELIVLSCDTQVHKEHIQVFGPDDDLASHVFKVGGRGGTEVIPAFEYVQEHYPSAEAIIYLTDLEIGDDSNFGPEPPCPVLWICTEKTGTAPWGEVVYMQPEDQHDGKTNTGT